MRLYTQIKQIVGELMEGSKSQVLNGTVTSASPLIVTVEQRLPLPREALIIGERFSKDVFVEDKKIARKLEEGDKLIILKLDGEYVVFDRIGDS